VIGMSLVPALDCEDFLRMATDYFSELNPTFVPRSDWRERYFSEIVSNPRYFLRWILCDGARAGFVLFGLEDHHFLPRKTGVIYELYVLPEFRRRGVAKACALEAIRQLRTYSPSKIQLEILDGASAAADFWTSLGFRKVSERFVLDRNSP
jgi:ribosomal protein S18 acetylase RimI-like enzyme